MQSASATSQRLSWCGRTSTAQALPSLSPALLSAQRHVSRDKWWTKDSHAPRRRAAMLRHAAAGPPLASAAAASASAMHSMDAAADEPSSRQQHGLQQEQGAGQQQQQEGGGASARSERALAQQQEYERRLSELVAWRQRFYECIVPRRAHDAPGLGEWVHRLRRLHKEGRLPQEQAEQLDSLGFRWTVDTVTAKWYSNFHAARQYQEMHGGALPAPDHLEPGQPQWEEAGRWLERQRELYVGQKLLAVRVRLLKEVLGVTLTRPKAPTRRNLHPVLRQERAAFQRELERRRMQGEVETGEESGAGREGQARRRGQEGQGRPQQQRAAQQATAQTRRKQRRREQQASPAARAEQQPAQSSGGGSLSARAGKEG